MYIESKRDKLRQLIMRFASPVLLIAVFVLFLVAVSRTASSSLESQRDSLLRALQGGAVRTYALTGSYPQSLDEILTDYHITYDHNKFIVEYAPTGSNLMPSVFVIPRKNAREE